MQGELGLDIVSFKNGIPEFQRRNRVGPGLQDQFNRIHADQKDQIRALNARISSSDTAAFTRDQLALFRGTSRNGMPVSTLVSLGMFNTRSAMMLR